MRPPLTFYLVGGLLVAGAAIASLAPIDRAASFNAVLEMWGDLLRDADSLPRHMVRVAAETEMEFGRTLADRIQPQKAVLSADTAYVISVGNEIVRHARRREIVYHFRVIESPQVNAFALPGGYIFVHAGLLRTLRDESQLAAILGHEVAHVDLRHCVDRFQYELKMKELKLPEGPGSLADALRSVAAVAYSPAQEIEADQTGQVMAAAAGYDPAGGSNAMATLQEFLEPSAALRPPGSPMTEAMQAATRGLHDFFRSHPRTDERARRLREVEQAYIAAHRGREYCRGAKNLAGRTSCGFTRFAEEMVRY